SGRVQGVGFRFYAEEWAGRLGVGGYARNLPDGRLEVVAEGPEEAVRDFLDAVRRGPRSAVVTGVELQWEQPLGEREFRIRYS
ncbi:MAG: acylphosphatase, partial [Armatimonadota bacterium]|nr:acylphosphatase [Armatimonadota bacterium]